MVKSPAKYDPAAILSLLDKEEQRELVEGMNLAVADEDDLRRKVADIPVTVLMSNVVELRLPFLKMLREVGDFLKSAKIKARSSARFVMLGAKDDFKFDFGDQMQGAIAECFEKASLRKSAQETDRRLQQLVNEIQSILNRLHSLAVQRDTPQSEYYSRSPDPGNRFLAERYKRTEYEYHPADRKAVNGILEQLTELVLLCKRLSDADTSPLTHEFLRRLSLLKMNVDKKAREVNGAISYDYPPVRIQVSKQIKESVFRKLSLLKEALLAASKFNDAIGALVDFWSLELWQHRWRLYELWTLVHVMTEFTQADFDIDLSCRIHNRVWSLKFTKDRDPVAKLVSSLTTLEVYYQLYSKSSDGGNMPDIALRASNGGPYIFVLDPKHGRSYKKEAITDIATRYQKGFMAQLTVIHNYYPMDYDGECAPASHSNCLLLSDVRPGGNGVRKLHDAMRQHLQLKWRHESSIVVLFDVSGSTASSSEQLISALEDRLAKLEEKPSEGSLIVTFADGIVEKYQMGQFTSDILSRVPRRDSTNISSALVFALDRLSCLSTPRHLWIFSDGQFSLNVDDNAKRINDHQIKLEIFNSNEAKTNDLKRLASQVQEVVYSVVEPRP